MSYVEKDAINLWTRIFHQTLKIKLIMIDENVNRKFKIKIKPHKFKNHD
jgi:hypothetical protein